MDKYKSLPTNEIKLIPGGEFGAVILKASNSFSYRPVKLDSYYLISAPASYNLVTNVKSFNIPKEGKECEDYLELHGLQHHADDEELCGGIEELPGSLYTKGNTLMVRFTTISRQADFNHERNFELVVTAAKKETNVGCRTLQYHYCKNQLCIPNSYTCDTLNNCGDNSDETLPRCGSIRNNQVDDDNGMPVMYLILIIFSVFVVLTLASAVLIYKCRKRTASCDNERRRISVPTVDGQLPRNSSYTLSVPSTSNAPGNPAYSPYYQNEGYQPYQADQGPGEYPAPPPYEEAVSRK